MSAQVFDVIKHEPFLQITIQVHRRDFGSPTQPKGQRKCQLMAGAYFKEHGRFRGTIEPVNTTNHFNPGAEPTERIWPLQAAKPALQLVINGVAQIRRQPS